MRPASSAKSDRRSRRGSSVPRCPLRRCRQRPNGGSARGKLGGQGRGDGGVAELVAGFQQARGGYAGAVQQLAGGLAEAETQRRGGYAEPAQVAASDGSRKGGGELGVGGRGGGGQVHRAAEVFVVEEETDRVDLVRQRNPPGDPNRISGTPRAWPEGAAGRVCRRPRPGPARCAGARRGYLRWRPARRPLPSPRPPGTGRPSGGPRTRRPRVRRYLRTSRWPSRTPGCPAAS